MRKKKPSFPWSRSLMLLFLVLGACSEEGMFLPNRRTEAALKEAALEGKAMEEVVRENLAFAVKQYGVMLKKMGAAEGLPRTLSADGSLHLTPSHEWTSGFFPGSLWYLAEYTHEPAWIERARHTTERLKKEQFNTSTHDLGFMMYCSHGQGYRLTGEESYRAALLQSAKSLATRYNPQVGCLRSWSFGAWRYPVIIDNMMNLELLFWASAQSGDPRFAEIARSHAAKTLAHHFRPDHSSYHLVDYDPQSGRVRARQTVQGYADESAWARGQAWGLYGFTMAYRETSEAPYLHQARAITDFLLHHPQWPPDGVPPWDLDAPDGPRAPRDASAAAIISSALYELASHLGAEGHGYLAAADHILRTLSGSAYRARPGENGGFLLKHAVGHLPQKSEVDVPLIYADYYFIEANMRRHQLASRNSPR
jgi:rhamnogalacturonyl hydrolase YesR